MTQQAQTQQQAQESTKTEPSIHTEYSFFFNCYYSFCKINNIKYQAAGYTKEEAENAIKEAIAKLS